MFDRGKTIFKRAFSHADKAVSGQSDTTQNRTGKKTDQLQYTDPDRRQNTMQKLDRDGIKNRAKFEDLVAGSNKVLYKTTTFFPFDFFPDEISIEPNQINIIKRNFFFSGSLISLPVKNIIDISVTAGPFFASISIIDNSFSETGNTISVKYLRKKEAQKVRRIVQGLIVASKEGIDLTKLNHDDLRQQTEHLGYARAIE